MFQPTQFNTFNQPVQPTNFAPPMQPGVASAGAHGEQRRDTDQTGAQGWQDITPDAESGTAPSAMPGQTFRTGKGTRSAGDFIGKTLPVTTTTQYGGTRPGTTVSINQLPPTTLSSFVLDSGNNEDIYGHEGETDNTSSAPIGEGMDAGDPDLTTGHQDQGLPTVSGEGQ